MPLPPLLGLNSLHSSFSSSPHLGLWGEEELDEELGITTAQGVIIILKKAIIASKRARSLVRHVILMQFHAIHIIHTDSRPK